MPEHDRLPPATGSAAGVAAEVLFKRVDGLIDGARLRIARAVNLAMVQAYWEIDREIVDVEQAGERRADYGAQLIERLSDLMTERFGEGFSVRNLERMRQFYLAFADRITATNPRNDAIENDVQQIPPAVRAELASPAPQLLSFALSWTHYRLLISVTDPSARSFYEIESARQGWSSRELERQIASHLFERLAASRDKYQVLALTRRRNRLTLTRISVG